ncbi:Lsr2 family protein [Nocardia sp. NPDC051570]|uniref:Lsr2 family protein n=1 Tax=Nocardia sp. NPDC051570 TaxID=3364324 RepID=UPI0037A341BC
MAQKTIVETYDDLTGERIDTDIVPTPTISFAVDGIEYEIELGAKNRDKFYAAMGPYTDAARRIGGRRGRKAATATGTGSASGLSKAESNKIREWAQSTGRKVSARGRLPKDLVEAYRDANN